MKSILFLICCFFSIISAAQQLTGTVNDSRDRPLANVVILNARTGFHTHTNNLGNFKLEQARAGDTLSFTHIGYKTEVVVVTPQILQQELYVILDTSEISLSQVVISSNVNPLDQIIDIDLNINPVKSSQEVLRRVPGLIIGQHAGGGKAEQIFLRGFDIDHGTDVKLSVDGLPVNMVSHAHGQGYSDLHFLIPETIEKIEFGKGPYDAEHGNFATAGSVEFRTKNRLDENEILVEYGQFNTIRTTGLFSILDEQNQSAYVASSLNLTDGPFDTPQNFNRFNLLGKYHLVSRDLSETTLTASHFQSKWDASGQIPQRAVDGGFIKRFGAIDDTEGGNTSRTNLVASHFKMLTDTKKMEAIAFYSHYDFELYSNFTFFLEDPVYGDQIKQTENRNILGSEISFSDTFFSRGKNFGYSAGLGFRYDDANKVELSRTANRKNLLERLAYGNIDETNLYGFLKTNFIYGNLKVSPELRLDFFQFDYEDLLSEAYDSRSESKIFASPKLNFTYTSSSQLQFFIKSGIGYHSNDTRVVVANRGEDILPAAYGIDLGANYKASKKLFLNAALWSLWLDQEFVYVGDAGIVEPSGRTRRMGVDLGARYEVTNWLYLFADANYTHARSTEDPEGDNFIPLAPEFTSTGGFAIENINNFSGSLNYRYVHDRPANEDFSLTAEGYFVTDLNLNYHLNNYTFGLILENLFNTDWNETQFATETRLFTEPEPVEEIHFTPGTPFFLRAKLAYRW